MNLVQLDLNLLVALRALLAEKNVTRAGAVIGRSQPAMSAALARLRELFRDELLVRRGREYQLTPRAEQLALQVDEVLSQVEHMVGEGGDFDPCRDARRFTVSTSDYATLLLLEPLLERVEALKARASFEFVAVGMESMAAVQSGDVDLALAPVEPDPNLESEIIFRDRWVCAFAADHPTLRGDRLGRRQYEHLPHISVSFGLSGRSNADLEAERMGIQRRIVATAPSFLVLPFLLRGTSLLALMPRRLGERFRQSAGLKLCKPPFPLPELAERMIWNAKLTSDPAHRWLRTAFREAARHGPGRPRRPRARRDPRRSS